MKFFIKLNTISILNALALFIAIELIVNVSHISRLTGWEWDNVYLIIAVINVIGLLLSTIFFIYLTKKWTLGRKYSYLSLLLWLPYFILCFSFFPVVFPINAGVTLFPRFSLLIYGSVILYPVYLLFINLYATPLRTDYEE
ncbi:hypothetical protein RCG19_13135 [Neobacillus sp. OS1-2]|uniref:hypothetical protein n=1 Tax=Neobacillus sp. OS1-2 TaxID=3070680 RepID=UPI0027E0D564|nr:hypothetical protein [Neobacillus sp. OS1-2]WML38168.1 hypothetical protein RCG19_13135 [Neobacillus sp. OS1-2]